MSATERIQPEQRYTRNRPCPICGGHTDAHPHCHGFLSRDGKRANCENEDHANGAESFETDLGTMYKHVLTEDGSSYRPWLPDAAFALRQAPTMFQRGANPRSLGARMAAAGLRRVDPGEAQDMDEPLPVVKAPKKAGETVYEYDTHQIVRKDYLDRRREWDKICIPRYREADGTWVESKLPENPDRVYRRASLAENPDATVYIVEGEKCVEAARGAGLTAITWLGGADAARRAHGQLAEVCKGRNIALLPDEETKGRKAMAGIAAALAGTARSIKVLDLYPHTEQKRDIVDWLFAGRTAEWLARYVADAEEYEPDPEEPEAEPEAAAAPRRFALYTPSQMKERPAITFAVNNLIPTGGFASLVGAPATYKSFIALDIAASIATQGFWHDRDAEQGGVIYISAEGASGMGQRIRAWETARHTTIPDTFQIMTDAPQLRDEEDVAALVATAADFQAKIDGRLRLIVVDTFARTFSGEENSSKEVGEAISAADLLRRATGAAVLLVHHLNKAGTSSRGSSALLGALDVEITATREAHSASVKLEITKAKDFGEGEPIMLAARVVELEGGGTSLVLDPTTTATSGLPMAAKNVAMVLHETFGAQGATATQWQKVCEEKKFVSSAFYEARKDLIRFEYINEPPKARMQGFVYWLTATFFERYNLPLPPYLQPKEEPPATEQPLQTDAKPLLNHSSASGLAVEWFPPQPAQTTPNTPEAEEITVPLAIPGEMENHSTTPNYSKSTPIGVSSGPEKTTPTTPHAYKAWSSGVVSEENRRMDEIDPPADDGEQSDQELVKNPETLFYGAEAGD